MYINDLLNPNRPSIWYRPRNDTYLILTPLDPNCLDSKWVPIHALSSNRWVSPTWKAHLLSDLRLPTSEFTEIPTEDLVMKLEYSHTVCTWERNKAYMHNGIMYLMCSLDSNTYGILNTKTYLLECTYNRRSMDDSEHTAFLNRFIENL